MSIGANLISVSVDHVRDALKVFGEKRSDGIPIVARPLKAKFPYPIVSVPSGVHALKYRQGVLIREPMQPGLHFLSPFEEVRYVITKQDTPFDIPNKTIPCSDNIMVKIDIFLCFNVHDPILFIESLSPEKLGDLLRAAQEEAIRNLARKTKHSEIYDLVAYDESSIVDDLRQKFLPYGVTVTEVRITDVSLPRDIAWRLEQETTFISRHKLQLRKQEFDMTLTKHIEFLEQTKLQYQNERLAYIEQAKRERALIGKEIDEIEQRTKKLLAETAAEQDRIVRQIQEEANKFCANLDEEREALMKRMRAEAHKVRAALMTEAKAFESEIRAGTAADIASLKAQITMLEAHAESESAPKLQEKRAFDKKLRAIDVSAQLGASNGENLVISGSTGGNLVAQQAASSYQRHLFARALADESMAFQGVVKGKQQ